MAIVSMKKLLESGVHFGHRTNKWNPKMKKYIFTERNGIHIIDLQQTVYALNEAYNLVVKTVQDGGTILFVGTKRQAQENIRDEAERCGMPYVTERWLGGTLTNWYTIKQRITELERLEELRDSGDIYNLTKKEGLMIEREITRLNTRLSGIRHMNGLPSLIFVVDISREATTVHEANLRNVPVLAMVDTNCDPRNIDYVIPSNDDAIRAIKLIVSLMADAVLEGKSMVEKDSFEAEEAEMAAARKPVPRPTEVVEEIELSDEDLLGASTLAKIDSEEKAEEAIADTSVVEVKAEEVTAAKKPAAKAKVKAKKVVAEKPVAEEKAEEVTAAKPAAK
ncbi:MAG: 30S ribosomal protein S2, partial [Anaerolineaceae bacterium]|nr:30S ribosomal protein S2 [Anaerolineaceae bacterium]